jgi:hypothetical protein
VELAVAAAALLVALAALAAALDARRRAGRGDRDAAGRPLAPPERPPPAPEFVKPAGPPAPSPGRSLAVADPLLVARVEALEVRLASLAAGPPADAASAVPRRAPVPRGDAAAEPRSPASRRVFP